MSAYHDPACIQAETPDMEPLVGLAMDDGADDEAELDMLFGWDTELDILSWELAIERQREESLSPDAIPF